MTITSDASPASCTTNTADIGLALFPLGQVVATPGVLALLEEHGVNLFDLLARHASGDWGDICAEDAKANDAALIYGNRVLSCYTLVPGDADSRVWSISEADRSVTTLIMPSEY
jgi:hypothetical protein